MSTIVIANSVEQARCQMKRVAPELLPGARVVSTHSEDGTRLLGLRTNAQDIVLTEGWAHGRHALHVEDSLRRSLAARGQSFNSCTRIEGDHLVTT